VESDVTVVLAIWLLAAICLAITCVLAALWHYEVGLVRTEPDSPSPSDTFWPLARFRSDVASLLALLSRTPAPIGDGYRRWARRFLIATGVFVLLSFVFAVLDANAARSPVSPPSASLPPSPRYLQIRKCLVSKRFAVTGETRSPVFGERLSARRESYVLVDVAPNVAAALSFERIIRRAIAQISAGAPSQRGLARLISRSGTTVWGWTNFPSMAETHALILCVRAH
jgi:hypothetical protein